MLRSLEAIEKGFQDVVKKSKEECKGELEKLRKLIANVFKDVWDSVEECCPTPNGQHLLPKYEDSLAFTRLMELLFGNPQKILILSCNGLYRDAFDNINISLNQLFKHYT